MEHLKLLCFVCLVITPIAWSQTTTDTDVAEEITVTASKTDTPLSQFNGTAFVITAEEMEQHHWKTVADVLQFLPGVSIAQTGGDGGVSTVFLRGANAQDTLVLLDGVKVNDAAGVARGYDFAHLSTSGLERIELLLGPQSTLYGSDASAGVINIITRRGASGYKHVGLEGSDQDSLILRAGIGDQAGKFSYAGNIEFADSESISARVDGPATDLEEDGYRNINGNLNLGYAFNAENTLSFGLAITDSESDFDATDGDDPNFTGTFKQSVYRLGYAGNFVPERWSYNLFLSRSDNDRTNLDQPDSRHPSSALNSDFEGQNTAFEFRNTVNLHQTAKLIGGVSYEKEEGRGNTVGESAFGPFTSVFSEDASIQSLYARLNLGFASGLQAELGARHDDHSQFGGQTTYQVSAGYQIEPSGTRLHGFYGTGFKAPSIFQLYSGSGNPALLEENSRTWELGATQSLLEGTLQFGATYFDNQFEDLIDFFFDPSTFLGTYLNIDEVETSGFELFLAYQVEIVRFKLTYENLDADDVSVDTTTGLQQRVPLVRRLDDKAALLITGEAGSLVDWNLDILHYGEALDLDFSTFPASTVTLDDYTLVNLGLRFNVSEHLAVHVRGENLFDETYARVLNYGTHGRRVFLGVNLSY